MELLVQTLVNGLVLGAGYAVIAVGLTLIFGIVGIANFAHGAFFAMGGYACYLLTSRGMNYFIAVPLSVLIVVAIGTVTEWVVIRRSLYGDSHHGSLIVTFALGQAAVAGLILIFGPDPLPVTSPLGQSTMRFLGIFVTSQRAFIFVCSVLVLGALGLWLRLSIKGQQVVAVAQNARGALYSGIDVPWIRALAFVLGVAAAGLAGALLAPISTIYPTMGYSALIVGFTVVILGGMGSIPGAMLGALLIGVANALFETYVSVSWTPALGWGLVIATLLFRPQGLLGQVQQHRH
ncbi:branched-chain amino acid ABC transporter permease [Bradyrhizobium sp. 87]|nr:branched-chain amino acid ABC transporter permease [Bradyrhizobium sp. 87]